MQTMTTTPKKNKNGTVSQPSTYKVKLLDGASRIWDKEYTSQPSFTTIVGDVKAALGS